MAALHVESREGGVAVVTLDDPKRRNALSAPMVEAIVTTFDQLEADESVGAIVVTGAPPAFCAGADLSDLGAAEAGGAVRGIYEGFLRVLRSPLPTVAAVNGPAVGAGLNLALACDVRIAGEGARFDTRFVSIGLHPGGGHTRLLERAVGPQAAAATVLFSEVLDGPRAAAAGLAWRCVPDRELLDTAITFAARAAYAPRALVARVKATLREAPFLTSMDAAVDLELERQMWSFEQGWLAERLATRRPRRAP